MNRKLTVVVVAVVFAQFLAISAHAQVDQERTFSVWSAPVDIGPPINLPEYNDQAAVFSRDQNTMYFTSNRPGSVINPGSGTGSEDIWVATRRNKNSPWRTPVNLGTTINTSSTERVRTISDDDKVLLFQSDRNGGLGGFDIWAIIRKHPNDSSWSQPINLGRMINTGANEIAGRYVFASIPKIYFSSARTDLGGLGGPDIYESEIFSDGSFGTPVNRFELNSSSVETCFWVRSDGLEIFFSTNRPNTTGDATAFDLWTATRSNVYETWSTPVSLGPSINAAGITDVNPALSADAKTLLFSSNRTGDMNIYMMTRRLVRSNQ